YAACRSSRGTPRPSPKRSAISYCADISPAIAAARKAGPPIAGGNMSIGSSGAFIVVAFDGAGGAGVEGGGRGGRGAGGLVGAGGSEAVGWAALGDGDGVAGAAGAGEMVGAALGATAGVGRAPGDAVAEPALPAGAAASGAKFGTKFGATPGTGATGGVGADVAAGDGSALPKGCADPPCGCAGFVFFCGGVVGSAGLCH